MVISWWITRNILEQLPIHGWFYLRVVIFHRYFLVYFFGKPLDLLSWPNFLYLGIWEPGSLFRVFLTTEVIKELDRGDCGWPWTPMDPSQVGYSGLVQGHRGFQTNFLWQSEHAIFLHEEKPGYILHRRLGYIRRWAGVYPCFQWDSHLQPGIHNKSGFHNPWTILVFVTQIVSNFLSLQTHMCAHNKLVQTGAILLNLGFAEVGQRPVHVGWGDSSRHQRCGRPSDRGDMHPWSYGL